MFVFVLVSCGGSTRPCPCEGGHGVEICEGNTCTPCQCLMVAPPTEDPAPAVTRFVDADASGGDGSEANAWTSPDWAVLDRDVALGHVLVVFDASDTWPEPLEIRRTDQGPHRIVLDGIDADGARAVMPGIRTGDDDVPDNRITVRGFDVTGSRDKGIYWRAGDDIVIEDNLVHGNRGSPSISLDYTSRTHHRSTSFVVRNNHVWDQKGECIYIGGAEGEDIDAHELVVVENNLVHDCGHPLATQDDGINIKDRIGSVSVAGNVVIDTKWGIEIASPGEVRGNLLLSTRSNGIHVTDEWGLGPSNLVLQDNVIVDAGEAGIYLNASNHLWSNVTLSRLTIVGARQAAIEAGGAAGIDGSIDDVVLAQSGIGLDAWSPLELDLTRCTVHGNGVAGDREFADLANTCVETDPRFGELDVPAGPDGRFFTQDDPWLTEVGGVQLD